MFDFLSKLGAPDEVQGQFGQLVDQFGPPPESVVNDLSTLSQRQKSGVGGGMFDAYSESNQGNLKMAMLVDIIGKLGGRDVGAMKTMMPLAENARKLRLQGEENAAYDKMVSRLTPKQQKLLASLPVSMRPMAMKQFLEQQLAVPTSPLVSVGGKGENYLEKMSAEALGSSREDLKLAASGAANKLDVHNNVMHHLTAKDENNEYIVGQGAVAKYTQDFRSKFNSLVETFGGEAGLKRIGLSSTTQQEVLDSNNKDLALLAAALMKGNLSEKELDFSVALFARLGNTREANIILTKMGIMKEQAIIARHRHMTDWQINLDRSAFTNKDGAVSPYQLELLRDRELGRFNAQQRKENGYRMELLWHNDNPENAISKEAMKFLAIEHGYKEEGE
jgi:hypothetical protein